jgi:hypothetical protein
MKLFSLASRSSPPDLTAEAATFRDQGFVILRGVFKPSEMAVLKEIIAGHAAMRAHAARARERSGGDTRPSFETVFVWNDTAGRDAFAKATRSSRIIDRVEAFLGDKVYVYHNKVAQKYPGVVGFSYHQDYAYWYQMGNLFPDMATAFIAIDRATRANGCLKLIAGSHRLGRLDHVYRDGVSDSGVDEERLVQILKVMPEVPVELDIGDAVIFHCNVLHASDDNHSPDSRIALLGCYNTRHNDPFKSMHGHPGWHPQTRLSEEITRDDLGNIPDFDYQWKPGDTPG